MTRVTILALALALVGADAAAAATLQASYHRSSGHMHAPRPRHSFRISHRRPHRIRLSAPHLRPAPLGAPGEFVRVADNDDSKDGWFKSRREAGWGVSQGSAQMVAGLYQRPENPDIPGPQTLHTPEGRGAAGLSLSLKLGQ
jgi:hypothetical protein